MGNEQIALLTIAVVAMGIVALPSTISLFVGQHEWYDLSAEGNEVPCDKCYADVGDEISNTVPHADMLCWYCHRTGNLTGYIYVSGDGNASTPGQEARAASVVECMACHEGFDLTCADCHGDSSWGGEKHDWRNEPCGNCHKNLIDGGHPKIPGSKLEAGGFNLTINLNDTGEKAAHKEFVLDAMNDTTMAGANEACLACHTMIGAKLSWTHARSLEFDIEIGDPQTTSTGVHNWTISNWAVNGTATATVRGNTSGAGNTSYQSE